jgi:hypothetical protein
MDARLQEMLDHHEIRQVLATYCAGCDRLDTGLLHSVYAADSFDNHGRRALPGHEFAEVVAADVGAHTEVMFHLLGQSLIRVTGDEAGAETYFLAVSRERDDAGALVSNQLGGRFLDTMVREDGRWKIRRRDVVREWTSSQPVDAEWTPATAIQAGQRSGADLLYATLGLTRHGAGSPA